MRLLLACLALLVLAAPASAGVVSINPSTPSQLTYTGGDEASVLTISDPSGTVVRFVDTSGVSFDASADQRCFNGGGGVECNRTMGGPAITRINVNLGGGDDTFTDTDVVAKTLDGGAGADKLTLGGSADTVTGGPGDDRVTMTADGGADDVRGGTGIDQVIVNNPMGPINVTLDDAANDGGGPDNLHSDLEDIAQAGASTAADTLGGSGEVNAIVGGEGGETIDGGGGSDLIDARGGNDTISSRDGAADRIACGDGADTVNADQLDSVSDSCETVNRETVGVPGPGGGGGGGGDDAPPTVTWTSTTSPLKAGATDDKGVARVVFMAADAIVCTDNAAPFECAWTPTEADIGRTTLTAVAVDTAGQTATATRTVTVPKFTPTLSAAAKPKRDKKAPYAFTISGKLTLPAGAKTCSGDVTVSAKGATRRVAKVKANCSYSARLTFRKKARRISVSASYAGSTTLNAAKAKAVTVRAG